MELLINLLVLLFEVLYYSLFMKFARINGKFWKYVLGFSIATAFNIIFSIIGLNDIVIYVLFMLIALYTIKIFDKKVNLYDLFFIFVIMAVKIAIEGINCLFIYHFVNNILFTIIIDILKFSFLLIFKSKIKYYYDFLFRKWRNNNFFIRYIFNILLFVFIIMSFIFVIIR